MSDATYWPVQREAAALTSACPVSGDELDDALEEGLTIVATVIGPGGVRREAAEALSAIEMDLAHNQGVDIYA